MDSDVSVTIRLDGTERGLELVHVRRIVIIEGVLHCRGRVNYISPVELVTTDLDQSFGLFGLGNSLVQGFIVTEVILVDLLLMDQSASLIVNHAQPKSILIALSLLITLTFLLVESLKSNTLDLDFSATSGRSLIRLVEADQRLLVVLVRSLGVLQVHNALIGVLLSVVRYLHYDSARVLNFGRFEG